MTDAQLGPPHEESIELISQMNHGDHASAAFCYHICNSGAMHATRGTRVAAAFQGHLVSIRGRLLVFGVIVVGIIGTGHSAPRSSVFHSELPASDDGATNSPRDVSVDFNGNEVRRAVARYNVDPLGALYEEHSPETEVPRLGSPKG
jgi:hypothetical protein